MKLMRSKIPRACRASDLSGHRNGAWVTIAGMVICRQRPGTARGYVFVSLEDETGVANAILTPEIFERFRLTVTQEQFLEITGVFQQQDDVIHIKARRIRPLMKPVGAAPESHDFR